MVKRAESRRSLQRRVQHLRHAVAGRIHAYTAAEKDADRCRAVPVDDTAQARAEIAETMLPGGWLKNPFGSYQRALEAPRIVVHPRQRAPLGTHVAARDRMIAVAAHGDDFVTLDVDHDAAHGCADAAIAAFGSEFALGHLHTSAPSGLILCADVDR